LTAGDPMEQNRPIVEIRPGLFDGGAVNLMADSLAVVTAQPREDGENA